MLRRLVFLLATLGAGSASPAQTAREMVASVEWGVLVTSSTRTNGTDKGDAFGNPNSLADVAGVPYIYGSQLDASFVDIAAGNVRVSFSLSEAALVNADGAAKISACKIGGGPYSDPENPPCARLVLSGIISKVVAGSDEEGAAKRALFARHPSFKNYPKDHDFFVAKLSIDGIWLISAYGGATIVSPSEYFAVTENTSQVISLSPTAPSMHADFVKPLPFFKASTARWMAKNLDYGFLCTTSTRTQGTTIGNPFGNPYSFADVDGVPYVYASDLDASMVDLFIGNGSSAPAKPRATFAMSEASLRNKVLSSCRIGGFLGDPENPLCARLVLSGIVSKLVVNSTEELQAKNALFSRHPSFKNYPPGHSFYVAKLEIDGIWLIDIFGGAAIIKPSDYFKAH